MKKEFILFIISGGIAAVVNILSRSVLSFYMSFAGAIFFGYLIGMLTAFILMKQFVFESKNEDRFQVFKFALVNIIAIVQILIFSFLLKEIFSHYFKSFEYVELLAHSISVFIPVITSYFLHKYFTFDSLSIKN